MSMKRKWLSNYNECDICHGPIKGKVEYFVDGKVRGHSYWALMCPACYITYGTTLGSGLGQKYHGTTAELLEGGCEEVE